MTNANALDQSLRFKTRAALQLDTSWSELERAIVMTVAYADVFDYPLTSGEIHRYLAGVAAAPAVVEAALRQGHLVAGTLAQSGPYVMLPGREAIVETRRRRAAVAERMWPAAVFYGRMIGRLPFVRMVAVTGALAVSNVDPGADIDYLVITEPGRLWLCRAIIIGLVRLAARRGHILCPNYLLSERALALGQRSLYGAHELMQMVPITGVPCYNRMRRANPWADELLPNAAGMPYAVTPPAASRSRSQAVAELALRTRAGGWLERWEMERKVRKFSAGRAGNPEISLNSDCCKGHFDGHGQRTLAAYEDRVRTLRS
ncbi:MAG TPA: hypothetical protein VD886_02520 [Herpetosiphonaceae bacterium]|nr:hypothetical protein [Herpetosiphonaceae bacterium]